VDVDARPYHHGALRPALLEAAEQALERDGPERLSLRAIARAAGVSHAAPAHHFGDLRGLLTALAAAGFQRFTQSLQEAATAPEKPLQALGRAYVRFARTHPGLFLLMFRSTMLDGDNEGLQAAKAAAFETLAQVAAAGGPPLDGAGQRARPLASWCLVHGFAMLLLDGRLPSEPGPDELLEAVLNAG
jgi:AcrR family transcriptional regulator